MAEKLMLRSRYDRFADVLYITTPDNAPAKASEDDEGLLWRYSVSDGHLVGATVMDYAGFWKQHRSSLASRVSKMFKVSLTDAKKALPAS